jgi:hypothetical protein
MIHPFRKNPFHKFTGAKKRTYDIFWCFSLLRFLDGTALFILDSSSLEPSSLLKVELVSSAIEGPLMDVIVDRRSVCVCISLHIQVEKKRSLRVWGNKLLGKHEQRNLAASVPLAESGNRQLGFLVL